jgi:putative hydrolase of the HAD superfamily
MRPAVEGRVEDVDGFLAQALREERPALTGQVSWLDVLPGLLAAWGIAEAHDDVLRAWLTIEPVAVARDLVREVRAGGVPCYLASNQDQHRASYMQERLGYPELLDGAFYSCALGAAKPDPGYFVGVLGRLGLPAEQVLLVDDNPDNVAAARGLGLAAEVWSYREEPDVLRAHLARHGALS